MDFTQSGFGVEKTARLVGTRSVDSGKCWNYVFYVVQSRSSVKHGQRTHNVRIWLFKLRTNKGFTSISSSLGSSRQDLEWFFLNSDPFTSKNLAYQPAFSLRFDHASSFTHQVNHQLHPTPLADQRTDADRLAMMSHLEMVLRNFVAQTELVQRCWCRQSNWQL